MTDGVVITGIGVVSPLGTSIGDIAARFCAGETAVGPLHAMGADAAVGAIVDDIPLTRVPADKRQHIGRLDRLCRLFLSASYLAVDAAALHVEELDAERVGLSFGTGLGCLLTNAEYNQKLVDHGPSAASPRLFAYTVSSAAAGEVSIALGIKGPNVTSHAGLAAGLQAIGYGCDLIRTGKADVVLAGGADALGAAVVHGLADMGLLKPGAAVPFADRIRGVCPSEGAAVIVLEREALARQRGAQVYARVDGYALGFEPRLTQRSPEYTGIVETMRRAVALSGRAVDDVGLVIASAHATALDALELAALRTVLGDRAVALCAPKVAWGETFGADGALSLALAAELLAAPGRMADGIALDLSGAPLQADEALRRMRAGPLALVHSLCYSGPTVTLVAAREQ